ncbi:GNAT family N-acetyltransferase [Halomonas sp. LR5S13]|uniref:GNAT family N-acetyltransferase n=1 Tax=Halomonas rhizosphaerae TaxID=3043296 RepID=UPI0024A91BB2|nr:GNAT family N-acetyltransferase [Halomonas rhizosphaerae]MDI5922338.1 GNAT family N-acetyltransferase [Halomonas rhizosphaerae]
MRLRDAVRADARDLAYLINLAGEGLPEYLWGLMAEGGESPLEVGMQRAARQEGGFSYRHARVCIDRGRLVGMILAYRLPEAIDPEDLEECPAVVEPLLRLEARVPGSWYINAIATLPAARRKGIGRLLMAQAEASAIAAGCDQMSLIVAAENAVARSFYQRLGFLDAASLPLVPWPGCAQGGDWVLMTRRLESG